jgi:alanine racemase
MTNTTSYIEISKQAFEENLKFIHELIGPKVLMSSVVKGNAYGHGIEDFVQLATSCGVRHFSVFSTDEAERVWSATKGNVPIMIMGMIDPADMEWVIRNGISFFVFDRERLYHAEKVASRLKIKAQIHLELETGMNRTGFVRKEFLEILEWAKVHPETIQIVGLCTHFAGAESIANFHRITMQHKRFRRSVLEASKEHVAPAFIHAACSAAAIRFPQSRHNLVRVGIMQYGFFPNKETLVYYMTRKRISEVPLKRLISWKTRVMDIKKVPAGEFVGYGTSFLANRETFIALIPVGYSHGFTRGLSNNGKVLIQGQRLNVIGMVNMNMMAVDITGLEGVCRGDEVVLIGKQGQAEISVASFGEFSEQVNYELLTRLPQNIPRIIVD